MFLKMFLLSLSITGFVFTYERRRGKYEENQNEKKLLSALSIKMKEKLCSCFSLSLSFVLLLLECLRCKESRLFWLFFFVVLGSPKRCVKVGQGGGPLSLSLCSFCGHWRLLPVSDKKNRQFIKKCMTFPSPLTNQNRNKPMARLQGHHTLHTHTHNLMESESLHKETASWEKTTKILNKTLFKNKP